MKNIISVMALISLLTTYLFTGCREYKTKTKINIDGTVERTIVTSTDTSNIKSSGLFVPEDKSWNIKIKKEEAKEDVLTASKTFKSIEDMNWEYKEKSKVKTNFALDKKFAWFYTYLTYREIYTSVNPFNVIDVNKFFSKDEYKKIMNDDTSAVIQQRIKEYFWESMNKEQLDRLLNFVKSINDEEFTEKEILEAEMQRKSKGSRSEAQIWLFIKPQAQKKYLKELQKINKEINQKVSLIITPTEEMSNEVVLPGIIIKTNSKIISGNNVSWKFDLNNYLLKDYEMFVESRVTNVWAFIVTGVVVLLLITLLIAPRFKKSSIA